MKSRPAPDPLNYKRPLPKHLRSDPQVIKWSKRLLGDRSARPRDLSEEQLAWAYLEVLKRRPEFMTAHGDLYLKAMSETCPILAAPELERQKLAEDLELLLSQPEMGDFWDGWQGRRGPSGPTPDWSMSKALMMVMATGGISPHIDDAYAELTTNQDLWDLTQRLAGGNMRQHGYKHLCKQLPKLAAPRTVIATNIRMIKALADLMPGQGIGERLMIDGMPLPAWCKQVGTGKSDRQEQYRRRLCPEAGARMISHGGGSKRDVLPGDKASTVAFRGTFWRGYYLIVIADQATGLPLVWLIQDASLDEAQAIVPLLSDLFRYWPECPAKVIAGDSAWDEDYWCRLAEVDYGMHPIFRLHDSEHRDGAQYKIDGFSRDGSVVARTGEGQLLCASHRELLEFAGSEAPKRAGLRPGQSVKDEGAFRVRARCPKGCGTLSMRMQADWSSLTHYPHYLAGKASASRYAYREAMLTRLNGIETIFDRLQTGRKLGTESADRTRLRDKGAHEMLVSLALMTMTAAALADQRRRQGISYPGPGSGAAAPAPLTSKPSPAKNGSAKSNGKEAPSVSLDELLAGIEVLVDV